MPVSIDASAASRQAIEMYDKDGDGTIAETELTRSPESRRTQPLRPRRRRRVSRDEIAARINDWSSQQLALMGCSYIVTLDGQPLEPKPRSRSCREPYLGPM